MISLDKIIENKVSISWKGNGTFVLVSCPSPYTVDGSGFIFVKDTCLHQALTTLFLKLEESCDKKTFPNSI